MAMIEADYDQFTNPVDMVEHIATIHDWAFERTAQDELTLSVSGVWCDYHLSLTWRDDLEALHLACAFDYKASKSRLNEIYRLIALINEQLWLGHFDLWTQEGLVMFRHALLLNGAVVTPGQPSFADVIQRVKAETGWPLAAYHVSGEYAAILAAAERGWLDGERAMREALIAIARAGADVVITYWAREFARLEG